MQYGRYCVPFWPILEGKTAHFAKRAIQKKKVKENEKKNDFFFGDAPALHYLCIRRSK